MNIIECRNVSKNYENKRIITPVLKDINLSIKKGEFCGITGPSGSGKTTLLYVMSALEKCSTGEVLLFNKSMASLKDYDIANIRKRNIGFVFQFYNLISNLTVEENIQLAGVIAGNTDADIEAALRTVHLEERKNYFPAQLSGGEQQRTAIARALLNNPDIIFADEPTGNLDVAGGAVIMNLLKELNSVHKKTIVLVTHDQANLKHCTRHISLLDGMIICDENITL